MKQPKAVIIGFALLMLSSTSFAQERLSWEFRPGLKFPTKDLGDADTKLGFGFEATIAYRFLPHLAAYAGWGWSEFKADEPFGLPNVNFEETGYTFGLHFIHPFRESSLSYLFRIGLVYNQIEIEDGSTHTVADSDHGLGWQIGTGIDIDLVNGWHLRPELRYRSLSGDIVVESRTTDIGLNYISFGVGISRRF